jgi:hypothetical protein
MIDFLLNAELNFFMHFAQDLLFCPDFTVSANKKNGPVR